MEFKGTKGEWKVKHSESKNAFNVVGTVLGGNYKIARVPYFAIGTPLANNRERLEAEANAKLIAASPLIIEYLIRRFDYLNSLELNINSDNFKEYEAIKSLIIKATE